MINRVGDFGSLTNDSFEKLAKIINEKNNKKLYKTCTSQSEASIAIKELKVQGYKSQVEKIGNNINVYSIAPEKIELIEAEKDGGFKKLAWGRYCFQKANSINNFNEYNFDDGSIWRIITEDDGKQYLVKEVNDENEEIVIRKTASLTKKAAVTYVTDQTIQTAISIVYNDQSITNSDFFADMIASGLKQNIYDFVSDKIDKLIDEKVQQQNIYDSNTIQNLKEYISSNISNNNIYDNGSFNNVIDTRIEEILNAMEIL